MKWLLGTVLCLIFVFNFQPIRAQTADSTASKLVTVNLSVQITLTDATASQASGTLTLVIRNNDSERVIRDYQLPNVWQLGKINQVQGLTASGQQVQANATIIKVDFGNEPLAPKSAKQIEIQGQFALLKNQANLHILEIVGVNTYLPDQDLILDRYQISFPSNWGAPQYLNLLPQYYDLAEGNLYLKELLNLKVVWGVEANFKVTYQKKLQPGTGQQLVNFLRGSFSQKLELKDYQGLSEIYTDDSGNLYAGINLNQTEQNYRATYIVSKVKQQEHPQGSFFFWPVPDKIRLALQSLPIRDSINNDQIDFEATLRSLKNILNLNFQISGPDSGEFQLSDSGPVNVDKLSYSEYLTMLSSLLGNLEIKNQIVLVDRSYYGEIREFVLELCASSGCNYYSTDLLTSQKIKQEVPDYGLQLLAFSGVNQLTANSLENLAQILPTKVELANQVESTQAENDLEKQLNLHLRLPDSPKVFEKFQVGLDIVNISNQPIFFNELLVDGHHFSINTEGFSGLYQGVLSGQTKSFEISNVYITRLFLGEKQVNTIPVSVVYGEIGAEQEYTLQQKILLSQNYLVWGVSILGVLLFGFVIKLLIIIYRRDKYNIKAIFWKIRRAISGIIWQWQKK